MESGINADQNFFPRNQYLPPTSPDRSPQHQRAYDPPPLHSFEQRSPKLPPKLPFLTTQNLQAVTANGYIGGGGSRDADEFYRDYRGVQQSSSGFTDMAASVSELRTGATPLRSNGNGTTPKHPTIPNARTALKPAYRSASSPLDGRIGLNNAKSSPALNGYPNSRQPSVKDLLKRFDQNNSSTGSEAPKPPSRLATRGMNNGPGYAKERAGYQARATNAQNTAGTSRIGASTSHVPPNRQKSPAQTRTQRTRFATEDQHSNNTLSGAARPARPRNAASGSISQASKSMINLSPTSPNAPSQIPNRRPLFGEVLGQGTPDIAYGIPRAPTRRTSDSSLHPDPAHRRSKSDFDVSPSSPTAWYLGVTPALDDVDTNKTRATPGHNRNHSDFADTKVNTMNGVSPSFQKSHTRSPSLLPSASRLPRATNRLSGGSSDSSSLPSTRANSPFSSKKLANGKPPKPDKRPWSPAGRAVTPTNLEKTPTGRGLRGKSTSPGKINTNASLKAYISAPLPKTSPPLRSSRPRQPVSSAATTTTSKPKHAEPSTSPKQARSGMKLTRNMGGGEHKDRKISDTQLTKEDFAARRAEIHRAYTKSIALEDQNRIRAANLRRLQERQAHDLAVAEAAKAAAEKLGETPPEESLPEPAAEPPANPAPLHITTAFHTPQYSHNEQNHFTADQDSPTLGMPGKFVDDDEPASAISNATTEIDNEPQTEAARLSRMPSARRERSGLSSHVTYMEDGLSAEQALFGSQHLEEAELMEEGDSIRIMLEPATAVDPPADPTPTKNEFSRDPSPPGAYEDDEYIDYNQPVFATTLTVASPLDSTPGHSEAISPLSVDQPQMSYEDANISDASDPHEMKQLSQLAPEILLQQEPEIEVPESADEAPRFQLPMLRTALAPPSLAPSDVSHEYLNTPGTDMEYESSDSAAPNVVSSEERDDRDGEVSPFQKRRSAWSDYNRELSAQQKRTSAWTDYSVETGDEYSEREEPTQPPTSSFPMRPAPRAPTEQTEPTAELQSRPEYSPLPSPRFPISIPPRESSNRHQLPPLSTSGSFAQEISDSSPAFANISMPLWPSYSPPPPPHQPGESSPALSGRSPPPPSLYNRRPPSSIYQSSQNGAKIPESRRASDDVYSPRASLSTPRSSSTMPSEEPSADQSFKSKSTNTTVTSGEEVQKQGTSGEEVQKPKNSEEEARKQKRLYQRRMVIKELIDTESVYLKDMNVVEEIYKGTAEACPKLENGDIKAIFRNTDEIVAFSTMFLDALKSAGASVYSSRAPKQSRHSQATTSPTADDKSSIAPTLVEETDEAKDRKTSIGENFGKHLPRMQVVYADFLKSSEIASARLAVLQGDSAVKVWLSECNLVAKDLTQAWDLDALLVKPVQRVTRYKLLLKEIMQNTPADHPDFEYLTASYHNLELLLKEIDDMKERLRTVGKIVGRKRKESDVRSNLAKAFGRTREAKVLANSNRLRDDEVYVKLHEKFGDDYLRLQVVLRDVEFYTRQATTWTNDFLRYLSSMELSMRMSASPYPELESKWARFNMSMRDMGTIALEDHILNIRKKVIEPFEQVIQAYGPPGLAMKKRTKRRLDYERSVTLKSQGKKIDEKLAEQVKQYEALNETLKLELPKLSALTVTVGKTCLAQLVHIQTEWYDIWQGKVRAVLEKDQIPKSIPDICEMYLREFKYVEARVQELGIINGYYDSLSKTRGSQSTQDDDSARPSLSVTNHSRARGHSINSDKSPSLPTPDFAKRSSGQFSFSPVASNSPGLPQFAYQAPFATSHSRAGSGSPATPEGFTSRQHSNLPRPSTGRSHTSDNYNIRASNDYNTQSRRESGSGSGYNVHHVDGPHTGRPYSGVFHSAMPLTDGPEESQRSSRASSRDRNTSGGYNVLYLAASLFEFNISATKSEAGYPYLTYQAGEIFDVIGEKGELWLAKNQDDPSEQVGWIWSKHFARLATD